MDNAKAHRRLDIDDDLRFSSVSTYLLVSLKTFFSLVTDLSEAVLLK